MFPLLETIVAAHLILCGLVGYDYLTKRDDNGFFETSRHYFTAFPWIQLMLFVAWLIRSWRWLCNVL